MTSNDTICALATATGGAIGIIRVSGPQTFAIVSALCSLRCDAATANTIHYTHITDGKNLIDEVLVSVFRAPHSYTGEDSVEISCHGSSYIINKVLELLVHNGCRMAKPGEYTMRSYLNGKLDLSQAEAVADLIASTNKATHDIAMNQLRGHFSTELATLREQLLKLTSLLELELDFSDHEDLEFADRTELLELAQKIDKHITKLADSFHAGNAIKNGLPVAIVGAPNVGKSTLLNALIGEERSIVSDIQGTTRDAIEDTIQLGGITFRFIDTAGIRHTEDKIESLGIERTFQMIAKAQIVLWLIDDSLSEEEHQNITERCQGKTLLLIQNKFDLENNPNFQPAPSNYQTLKISAKYGIGLDDLRQSLIASAPQTSDTDTIITNARHYESLKSAHESLLRVIEGILHQQSGDLLSEDLRLTLNTLADITGGQITPQETLNNIFSHFCVGK